MSTTSEDFRENPEVMKDTLRELSEEDRQKYRSELDDENSIELFDKIIAEIIEKGGNVTKEVRNALNKEIGTPQTTPPRLAAEIKKMLKKNKEVVAREEKMADFTTLITLAAALLSRNDKKSLEDLAKVLALSLRLTVDLRRKNLFEFINMSSDKDKQITWSQDLPATQKLRR